MAALKGALPLLLLQGRGLAALVLLGLELLELLELGLLGLLGALV
jgi:hypothetical protein